MYVVVGVCTVAFVLTMLGMSAAVLGKNAAGTRDYVAYWASGQLLAHHADPYDAKGVLRLERSAGYDPSKSVMIMRNPPSALLLALPLGLFGAKAGELLWMSLLLAAWVASVRMVSAMHGYPPSRMYVLGYSFGPALVCLTAGQVALFLLFGLVTFLRLHRSSPFLAGMAVWLCMLKPHLFLPFGVVLAIWAIATKSYRVLLGLAVALGISNAVAAIFDPAVWTHYTAMLRSDHVAESVIPCMSIELRDAISPHSIWVQCLPAVLGCAWAIKYYRRCRTEWDWMEHGSLLVLVSVVVAPYAWLTDQSVVLPALLHGAYRTRSWKSVSVLALASVVIEAGILRGAQPFHSEFYIWTAPAWLAWYVWVARAPEVDGEAGMGQIALEPSP